MSLHLAAWLIAYSVLLILTLMRPLWGIALFFLTVFANPAFWWWGGPVADMRFNLLAVLALLFSMAVHGELAFDYSFSPIAKKAATISILILVNALAVHMALAADWDVSWEKLVELAKYICAFLLFVRLLRTPADFRFLATTLVAGLAYWGYEKALTGDFSGRLEKLKGPGLADSNTISIFVVFLIALSGALLFTQRGWRRWLGVFAAATGVELLNRFNSRGALLAFGMAGVVFILLTWGTRLRRYGVLAAGLGLAAVIAFLARDPRVVGRFETIFAKGSERDDSSQIRLITWKIGLEMIRDNPFGYGGHGFKKSPVGIQYKMDHAEDYRQVLGHYDTVKRALHNGYLQEITDWGIQGLILKLWLIGLGALSLLRVMRHELAVANTRDAFTAACLIAGVCGMLVGTMFVDFMDNEPVFWVSAAAIAFSNSVAYQRHQVNDRLPWIQPSPNVSACRLAG